MSKDWLVYNDKMRVQKKDNNGTANNNLVYSEKPLIPGFPI